MLLTRALAALVFAPLLLFVVVRGGLLLDGAILLVAILASWEFMELAVGRGSRPLKAGVYVATVLITLATLGRTPGVQLATLVAPVTLGLAMLVLARPEPIAGALPRLAGALFGVFYCGTLLAHLASLRALPHGLGLAVLALLGTWAADTFAYFAGRLLGRHKLYPIISPAKTLEGAVGGLLGAIAAAFVVGWFLPLGLPVGQTVALGIITALFGMLGDLVESMLKRSTGVKDSSHLIPGHGGVLDRFDAVMFAAPAVYYYLVWVVL